MDSNGRSAQNSVRDSVLVSIKVEPDGAMKVSNVELADRDLRLRFAFSADRSFATVFSEGMKRELLPLIDRALQRRGILVLPDLQIHLRHLILFGCRALLTPSGHGGEQLLIAFSQHFGNVSSIFHKSLCKLGAMDTGTEDVAVEILEEAYLPIMNLGEQMRLVRDRSADMDKEQLRAELNQLCDRVLALKFYQSMLVRLINAEIVAERESLEPTVVDTEKRRVLPMLPGVAS